MFLDCEQSLSSTKIRGAGKNAKQVSARAWLWEWHGSGDAASRLRSAGVTTTVSFFCVFPSVSRKRETARGLLCFFPILKVEFNFVEELVGVSKQSLHRSLVPDLYFVWSVTTTINYYILFTKQFRQGIPVQLREPGTKQRHSRSQLWRWSVWVTERGIKTRMCARRWVFFQSGTTTGPFDFFPTYTLSRCICEKFPAPPQSGI